MSAEDFFSRWSKRSTEPSPPSQQSDSTALHAGTPAHPSFKSAPPQPLPTLDDVGDLTPDSDYSAFVRQEVDAAVKRSALKKLFGHPQINVMDGLDIYIDDYTQFTPISSQMLAALEHAKDLLGPMPTREHNADRLITNPAESELPPRAESVKTLEESDLQAEQPGQEGNEIPAEAAPNDTAPVEENRPKNETGPDIAEDNEDPPQNSP